MALVAVYVRMSTDQQESSIDRQLDQIRLHCAKHNYAIHRVYDDQALKGYDWERPAFRELLKHATEGRFQGIVVDEPSRISRDDPVEFISRVVKPLKDAEVWLESVSDGRQDWGDLGGLILTTVRADKASGESANLGRRILTKWNMKAEQGKLFLGNAPYGYVYACGADGERTHLVPDEEPDNDDPAQPARVVRWLFETYAHQDVSTKWLAAELTARAIPSATGGRWRPCSVYRMLTRRDYCGDYTFNKEHSGKFYRRKKGGEVVKSGKKVRPGSRKRVEVNPVEDWVVRPDTHEPLVDRDTFALVQARLKENAARKASPNEMRKYPFLRLLVCGHCGAWMVAHKKKAWAQPRYECGSRHNFGTCQGYGVRQDAILGKIIDAVERELLDPTNLAAIEAEARELEAASLVDEQTTKLRQAIARLTAGIRRAEENLAVVPKERIPAILAKIGEFEQEKERTEREREELARSAVASLKGLGKSVPSLLTTWRSELSGDNELVHVVIRRTVDRVVLLFESRVVNVKVRHTLVTGTAHFKWGKQAPLSI